MNLLIIAVLILVGYGLYKLGYADGKLDVEFNHTVDSLDEIIAKLQNESEYE